MREQHEKLRVLFLHRCNRGRKRRLGILDGNLRIGSDPEEERFEALAEDGRHAELVTGDRHDPRRHSGCRPGILEQRELDVRVDERQRFPVVERRALRQQKSRREMFELQFLRPQAHGFVTQLVEGREHHLELELVLFVVFLHETPQIKGRQGPPFVLDLPEAVGSPRQSAGLREGAAAGLHITVLLAGKDDGEGRLFPAVEDRLWSVGDVLDRLRFHWRRGFSGIHVCRRPRRFAGIDVRRRGRIGATGRTAGDEADHQQAQSE